VCVVGDLYVERVCVVCVKESVCVSVCVCECVLWFAVNCTFCTFVLCVCERDCVCDREIV